MGCAKSKTKKKGKPVASSSQANLSEEDKQQCDRPRSEIIVNDNTAQTEEVPPIETVYVHRDDVGGTTAVLRTTYEQNKRFSTEETINLLKDEAYDILKKAVRKPVTLEEAVKLVRSSCALSQVNGDLLHLAVRLIRNEEIANMSEMIEQLMRAGNQRFSRQEAEDCIRGLFIFSEDRAAKNSLLKVIHEKLEKGNSLPKTDRRAVCTPIDALQMDASEHENVEVTVKKSVKRRSINVKDLEQRGLKAEDVYGKEVYIVSSPPEGLDEKVRLKAEELMHAAGSIYDSSQPAELKLPEDANQTTCELRKIMEAHKAFDFVRARHSDSAVAPKAMIPCLERKSMNNIDDEVMM